MFESTARRQGSGSFGSAVAQKQERNTVPRASEELIQKTGLVEESLNKPRSSFSPDPPLCSSVTFLQLFFALKDLLLVRSISQMGNNDLSKRPWPKTFPSITMSSSHCLDNNDFTHCCARQDKSVGSRRPVNAFGFGKHLALFWFQDISASWPN